ncbi:MAG: WYL domain-containing protein [Bacteroidetes bacterium]|jgi:predicted DNA-binding transcriptional regulator YafY|nr:WYL domain-containing protein [Bacteroidota bacterium]
MSINKNALLRYQVLDRCFRNTGRKYFWQDLLSEINKALIEYNGPGSGIKRRQLFDDIKFMESDQGWSVPLEKKREGRKVYYRYSDPNFSISNEPLNESEVNQIEAAISVLSRFSGAPQFEWVQELIPVLKDRLGLKETEREVISIESNIDLKGLDHLSTLYEAIINQQVLKVEYQDFKSDEPFQIKFHPYYLKQYNNRWFVFGLNEELDIETWNMALDRIKSINRAIGKYEKSEIDWKEYFYDIIGVTKKAGDVLQKVILEFSKKSAPYVQTKPLHPTQKTEEKDGKLIVRIEVIPNYELESLIMSFGENVKVIKPESLKEKISEKIKKMQ